MQLLTSKQIRRADFGGRRGGFTLLELLVVIGIAGAIMMISIPRFQKARAMRTARNARDVYAWTAQRARARAIQTGQTQVFGLNPSTERAWIVRRGGSTAADTLLTINFQTQYEATVASSPNSAVNVCYNPRGYAFARGPACNIAFVTDTVTFTHSNYTSRAVVRPLGRVQKL